MNSTLQQFGIDRLSASDRLNLIGAIWDSLDEADDVSMPDWHRSEVERRRIAADADPGAGIPWEQIKAQLADRS